MRRVLIVEDDQAMATALRDGFESEGYAVAVARDGEAGLKMVTDSRPDLVILDLMLPRLSGLDVCRRVRGSGNSVPVIILTARGQEIDKVLGLRLGADDYVTKPFGFMELVARAEAVLRRTAGETLEASAYDFGDVSVDFTRAELRKGGEPVEVSARELRLLRYFIEHKGEVLDRERLLESVWDYDEPPLTRTVDMHVAKLRKKIEDSPAEPRHIVTVHRMGYKFTG
ncbi:MAG: response regulator transcription factor [Acidobacteria bacterium]|nr:response regulator transcription factor [Acidobacteriota bacterium]